MKIIKLQAPKLKAPRVIRSSADGNLGVESINTIVTVGVTFTVDFLSALASRNYIGMATTAFGLLQYGNVIALLPLALEEIKDTSLAESNEVVAHFASVLDLENNETEALIEQAAALLPKIYELVLDGYSLFGRVSALVQETRQIFSGNQEDTAVIDLAFRANTERLIAA